MANDSLHLEHSSVPAELAVAHPGSGHCQATVDTSCKKERQFVIGFLKMTFMHQVGDKLSMRKLKNKWTALFQAPLGSS